MLIKVIQVFKKTIDSESRTGRKPEYSTTGALVSVFGYTLIIINIIIIIIIIIPKKAIYWDLEAGRVYVRDIRAAKIKSK
jgi:hypothetical protein